MFCIGLDMQIMYFDYVKDIIYNYVRMYYNKKKVIHILQISVYN